MESTSSVSGEEAYTKDCMDRKEANISPEGFIRWYFWKEIEYYACLVEYSIGEMI